MMIRGNGPSPAEAGGKATLTSIGVPSQLGAVLLTVSLLLDPVPHSRTPSVAFAVQDTTPLKTLLIAACALGATGSDPATTDTSSTSFRMNSPLCPRRVPRRTAAFLDERKILSLVRLAGRELVGDPLRPSAPLHPRRELGMAVADLRDQALANRRHGDLVVVALDQIGRAHV